LIEHKEIIGNKEVIYLLPEDSRYVGKVSLKIGEQSLHITKLVDGRFISHFLPFKSYNSIKDVTADIINKVPAFREHRLG